MSLSPRSKNEHRTVVPGAGVVPSLARYGSGLKSSVTGIVFWMAVVLPFLHLPLLATGLESPSIAVAFAALLGVNVIAVVLGQPYRRE